MPVLFFIGALLALAWSLTAWRANVRAETIEDAFPPEGQIVDVGGVEVHALVRGAGPDVVLIHGASGSLRDFSFSLVDRLAEDYRVIAFDRPGMGHSDHADPAYAAPFASRAESLPEQAELLRAAAAQLGAEAPIVVGHSLGGAVALQWAVLGGPSALVLLGAVGMEWPGEISLLYRVNGTALAGGLLVPPLAALVPDSYIENATDGVFAPDPVPEGYIDHVGASLAVRPGALRANARHVNTLKPWVMAMRPAYDALTLPIEWLHGTADTIVPADVHAIPFSKVVPHANVTLLEGVGHMPHHADEAAVVAAIDRAARAADLR